MHCCLCEMSGCCSAATRDGEHRGSAIHNYIPYNVFPQCTGTVPQRRSTTYDAEWKTRELRQMLTADPVGMGRKSRLFQHRYWTIPVVYRGDPPPTPKETAVCICLNSLVVDSVYLLIYLNLWITSSVLDTYLRCYVSCWEQMDWRTRSLSGVRGIFV